MTVEEMLKAQVIQMVKAMSLQAMKDIDSTPTELIPSLVFRHKQAMKRVTLGYESNYLIKVSAMQVPPACLN